MLGIDELFKLAGTQGIWALLFVILFGYVLRQNQKSDERYQNFIDNLIEKYGEEIMGKLTSIESYLFGASKTKKGA